MLIRRLRGLHVAALPPLGCVEREDHVGGAEASCAELTRSVIRRLDLPSTEGIKDATAALGLPEQRRRLFFKNKIRTAAPRIGSGGPMAAALTALGARPGLLIEDILL